MASAYIGFPQSVVAEDTVELDLRTAVGDIQSAVDRVSKAIAVLGIADNTSNRAATTKADFVHKIMVLRDARDKLFGDDIFFDPAWSILMFLYRSELGGRKVVLGDTCAAAGVPPTTALRWVNILEKRRFVVRSPDPLDGRRTFVRLTPSASERMARLTDTMVSKLYSIK